MNDGRDKTEVLRVGDLTSRRGLVQVLHRVSLSVFEREVVCLVGRNGAGKTTLVETIMGHLLATSGQIAFLDENITALRPHQRVKRGIAYAPDYCGVFPNLTVAENLAVSGLVRRASPHAENKRHRETTAIFPEIEGLMDRRGINLSGGQKKMVAITRAMALSPSLLIMDEALEGLAPVVVSRFIDAVMKIKQTGVALLMAESNLRAASLIADRLYAIDRGEIIFQGVPADFLENEDVMKRIYG